MASLRIGGGRVGDLTLVPYIVKTDLFGPDSERYRFAAELGRLMVPENRSNPDGNLIELAFVRLKSTAERPGPPLVFLTGGPGISGADGLKWEPLVPWFAALRESGDVIALDQRGTGMSIPRLDCLETWDLPLDRPGTREELLRIGAERARSCAAFWRQQGIDLAGYTTEESADDIDALRKALGVEKINLYGSSYGAHLALATIKRHPMHVDRAIVAMVEGPDHTFKLPSNVQKHLEHLARLVQADPRLNTTIPDFLSLVQTVLDRLVQAPVTVVVKDPRTGQPVSVSVGKFDLQHLTASGFGSRSFIQKLPARYYAMSQGDFTWLASKTLEYRRGWFGNAMSYMMDCASGASPERSARIQHEASATLLGDVINMPFPDICGAWGNPDLGAGFRAPVTSEVPVLFVSGTLDGRTPPSNVEEVRAGFPHSHHLIVEGGTHSTAVLVRAPGVTETMVVFLKGQPVTTTRASLPFEFAPLQ